MPIFISILYCKNKHRNKAFNCYLSRCMPDQYSSTDSILKYSQNKKNNGHSSRC